MVAANYIALPGSHRNAPAHEASTPFNPDEPMEVTVLLRGKAKADLSRIWTPEEYTEHFGATQADADAVAAFAAGHNLSVKDTDLGARTVKLAGRAGDFSDAFQVEMATYHKDGKSFRGRQGPVHVPAHLDGIVQSVHGHDERPVAQTHFRVRQPGSLVQRFMAFATQPTFTPGEVGEAYGFPTNLTGKGAKIAILELGGGYLDSDLQSFFSGNKLKTPAVKFVSVDGATNTFDGVNGASGEVELDIEVAGAIAPDAELDVVTGLNTDQSYLNVVNAAINSGADIISNSWGSAESTWTDASKTAFDEALQHAAALGIVVTVASGDNGSKDGTDTDQPDFPASSPHVVACGGTQLAASGATIKSESVWNDLAQGGGAAGGGVSQFFALPDWQKNAGVPKSTTSAGGRGVPDISGDAAPNTGYEIVVGGQKTVIGGTSAVAPLFAGFVALAREALGKKVGFLNPLLYSAKGCFNDIVSGNNGSYTAKTGYDVASGLGSPKGAPLLAAIKAGAPANG